MKEEWEKLKKKLDDRERTVGIDWKQLSKKELNIILANTHRGERNHWYEPVIYELEKRRHSRLRKIGVLTLIVAIIGAIVGIVGIFQK
jgi:hypothetical protein